MVGAQRFEPIGDAVGHALWPPPRPSGLATNRLKARPLTG